MAETPLRKSGWHYEADKSSRRFVLKRASEKSLPFLMSLYQRMLMLLLVCVIKYPCVCSRRHSMRIAH